MKKRSLILSLIWVFALVSVFMKSEASELLEDEKVALKMEENYRTEEAAEELKSTISWKVDGNTVIITGKGELTGDCDEIRDVMSRAKNVKFEDCVAIGSMNSFFKGMDKVENIDLRGLDTSQVTDMGDMFAGCNNLITLDLSHLDTSQVTNMAGMFGGFGGDSLTSLDLSSFDTSQVTDMCGMFEACWFLASLDLSSFNTSQVTDMDRMFYGCFDLVTLDLSSFDTSQVTNMNGMFGYCENLVSLNVSSFDTSLVRDTRHMFDVCNSLTTINVFKAIPTGSGFCSLPGTYIDEEGNKTTWITSDFAGKTLTKEGTPATEPEQPSDNPSDDPADKPTDDPSGNPSDNSAEQLVRNFVSRMYTVALGRDAEEAGLNDWTNRLLNHEIDGAGIANGFIMSEEFDNKKVSNEAYVDILYRTFFDREADEGGRTDWLTKLANGNSRAFVLAGFVNSVEFDNLCNRYGIIRGEMQTNETAIGSGVRQFIERCYNKVLGRDGEAAGIEDWTGRIIRGEESPESVAKLFFFSEEYANKNTDNEAFVETLYQTFMGRDSDSVGKADWVGRLSSGTNREEVLEGFSRSEEFAEILKSFGLR